MLILQSAIANQKIASIHRDDERRRGIMLSKIGSFTIAVSSQFSVVVLHYYIYESESGDSPPL